MGVELLAVEPHPLSATFETSIAACRLADGRVVQAIAKRGARHPANPAANWGGVPYEADVYRRVLPGVEGVPALYDVQRSGDGTVLVTELIADAVPAHRAAEPAALPATAGWIGRFHRSWDGAAPPQALHRLDTSWYVSGGTRALETIGATHPYRDIVEAGVRALAATASSFDRRPVVVHGDLYADNVLVGGGGVTVIDWGWAAWGAGEGDLAALIERWPAAIVDECIDAYIGGRWDGARPHDFTGTLFAARLHLLLRWIGHSSDFAADPRRAWRFRALRALLERGPR